MDRDFSDWTILLVDDEPDNLHLAAELLRFRGATVALAENGRRGLEIASQYKPTMILLDLAMPGMDGWETHRRLREQPAYDDVPIVALTALAMPQDVARVRAAGFDGYIAKPFRVAQFLTELSASMDLFQLRRRHQAGQLVLSAMEVASD